MTAVEARQLLDRVGELVDQLAQHPPMTCTEIKRIVRLAVLEHQETCPVAPRVRALEIRAATLIGFMVGSGLLGGAVSAAIAAAIGG